MSEATDYLNQFLINIYNRLLEPIDETLQLGRPHLSSLAHFTSHSVLEGIVRNEELWFSRVSEMNDVQEVRAGKNLIVDFATDATLIGRSLFAIERWAPDLWEEMREEFAARSEADFQDTFISCWSASYHEGFEKHDDLTMWRAYGNNGAGISIVIDPDEIRLGEGQTEIMVCPVFYETEDEFYQRAANYLRTFTVNLLSLKIETPVAPVLRPTIIEAFTNLCFYLAVTHKHPGFRAENEWRFVWTKNRPTDDALDHYLRAVRIDDTTRQKFCLPLNRTDEFAHSPFNMRDVVKRIIVGPSDTADLNVEGVRQLLADNGFDAERTTVTASSIPFRANR